MKHPPLIGITCGTSALDPHAKSSQDRLNHAYSRALLLAGGLPVILSNACGPHESGTIVERLDGLLLSGGYDVAPGIYGDERLNDSVEIDDARDSMEPSLILAALDRDLPVLAICRGIQVLNVALGGTLIQDIPTQIDTRIRHSQAEERARASHCVNVVEGTRLGSIVCAREMEVNSFHHQALKGVAVPLRVSAVAADGIVEAVELPSAKFVLGVQWHPEELLDRVDRDAASLRLFEAFIGASAGQ